MKSSETGDRRPGVRELAERLQRKNPSWSAVRGAAEAKAIWCRRSAAHPLADKKS
jgi:limonene-1,2-epoxide hydrolase